MITVLKWKKACINLFITYFNTELKITKLTSYTDNQLIWIWVINIGWGMITGLISCYQIFAPISAHGLISLWHFRCLRMGKIDVITYKYVINIFTYPIYVFLLRDVESYVHRPTCQKRCHILFSTSLFYFISWVSNFYTTKQCYFSSLIYLTLIEFL